MKRSERDDEEKMIELKEIDKIRPKIIPKNIIYTIEGDVEKKCDLRRRSVFIIFI